MKNNKTTKRVDLPVDEFINQFPLTAQLEIDYFFKENRSIRKSVPTVLDFLLDAFEGYEEEKEIKKAAQGQAQEQARAGAGAGAGADTGAEAGDKGRKRAEPSTAVNRPQG